MAVPAVQPVGSAAQVAPPTAEFNPQAIPGVIGVTIARHTTTIEAVLQSFKRTRSITRSQMGNLKAATIALHRTSIYSQQISRLAAGRVRQSHERLSLDDLMRRVVADNDWRYGDAGLQVEQHLAPVEVIVDPGLLVSLLEVAVDCAGRHGQAVGIWLHVKNWPEHAILTLKSRAQVATTQPVPDEPEDSLEWVMLLQLAQSMGVFVQRDMFPDHVMITLEFPRTVKQLEGLTAVEVDGGGDSAQYGDSKPMAGHRVLLVSDDERLRFEVRDICERMRLVLDVAPTTLQAVRYCELDKPDIILVDEKLRDHLFDQLRADLLRYDVNFPSIEIASAKNVVELAGWDTDRMSRISRDALKDQLASLLVMELAKVF